MCVFLANQFRKISFLIFSIKRNPIRQEKESLKKVQNIEFFSKRLVHSFCQKIELLIIFVFWKIRPQKNRFWKFWIKKECFLDQKKEVFRESNQWKSFQGVSAWVNFFAKMSIFRLYELLIFIAQKGVFSFQYIVKDILLAYIA